MQSSRADHYSGILILTLPGRFDECARTLGETPGVTVSVREPTRNRLIAVLEAPSLERLQDMNRRLRLIPGVATADPVIHFVDDRPDDSPAPDPSPSSSR